MEFVIWHYTQGINLYLRRWYMLMAWIIHYFSLPLLLPTLFYPWKRLIDDEEIVGLNLEKIFRQITFNLISRGIGAVVRFFLLVFGLLILSLCFIVGAIGLLFMVACPLIGIPYYLTGDKHNKRLFEHLLESFRMDKSKSVFNFFTSSPGKFILIRTGLDEKTAVDTASTAGLDFKNFYPKSLEEIVRKFTASSVWDEDNLRKNHTSFLDLELAARWWDTVYGSKTEPDEDALKLSQPGIGLELLFGYTPLLNQYSVDLCRPREFSHHLIGRETMVNRIERELTGGNSLVLVGVPGVGKKTVILEFAKRAMEGSLGSKLVYKRVLEFDYNFLLSESLDINQKKAKLSIILSEASQAGNIILVIKDLHRLTHLDVEGLDFTDLFEKHLEGRKLKIIAISSQVDYERFIAPNIRLRKFLQPVEVPPVTKDEALLIIFEAANAWEKSKRMIFSIQSLITVLEGCEKYVTDTPFPEKALELLDHVVVFLERNNRAKAESEDVNTVLAELTGISLAHLTDKEKHLLADLETYLHEKLVGQDIAVSLIAKSLRARTVGVKNENRPIGSFLFLGPTGVGKTQTAKALAEVYYGSEKYLMRFDMAEYAGSGGLERLIGVADKNQPGILTTAIKNKPASLLLLDEIEKAPPEVHNLFLSFLDEGQITDAFGKKISARHLFVIATSNAGAVKVRELVAAGVTGVALQKEIVEYVQKNGIFSPEFINRFDGVVVFQPLAESELTTIARLMLEEMAKNLKQNNIHLKITDELCQKVAREGYEPEYGARPMRRIVDITLGDILGKAILKGTVVPGDHIQIVPEVGSQTYHIQKV